MQIPFNRPHLVGREFDYIRAAIEDMEHISGDGTFTKRCQALLEGSLYVPKALLTTSCTDALEMAALLLDIQPGDEVIVPSFTFVSTANAFALRGARPVFIDVRADTLNLDENQLERLITPRTKAIVPVHYAGIGCEMDTIIQIAYDHKVAVVEDNAHGLFARYKGRYLGTMGAMGTQSFHETKNIIAGEGGALLINARRYIERAEIIREKGTNRSVFLRGQVDKYTWVDVGSSFLPSDMIAAFLYAQLEAREAIYASRQRVWRHYHTCLQEWAARNGIRLPTIPHECEPSYHLYYLILPTGEARDALINFLKLRGIMALFHYQPLHLSQMGKVFDGQLGDCPVSEHAGECLLRLPLYNDMSQREMDYVVDQLVQFKV